jgi:hypothetical protein
MTPDSMKLKRKVWRFKLRGSPKPHLVLRDESYPDPKPQLHQTLWQKRYSADMRDSATARLIDALNGSECKQCQTGGVRERAHGRKANVKRCPEGFR